MFVSTFILVRVADDVKFQSDATICSSNIKPVKWVPWQLPSLKNEGESEYSIFNPELIVFFQVTSTGKELADKQIMAGNTISKEEFIWT
jgi:hypothetical protein